MLPVLTSVNRYLVSFLPDPNKNGSTQLQSRQRTGLTYTHNTKPRLPTYLLEDSGASSWQESDKKVRDAVQSFQAHPNGLEPPRLVLLRFPQPRLLLLKELVRFSQSFHSHRARILQSRKNIVKKRSKYRESAQGRTRKSANARFPRRESEAKRNETKRNETKRYTHETKQDETQQKRSDLNRNETTTTTKRTKKSNQTKQNGTNMNRNEANKKTKTKQKRT